MKYKILSTGENHVERWTFTPFMCSNIRGGCSAAGRYRAIQSRAYAFTHDGSNTSSNYGSDQGTEPGSDIGADTR